MLKSTIQIDGILAQNIKFGVISLRIIDSKQTTNGLFLTPDSKISQQSRRWRAGALIAGRDQFQWSYITYLKLMLLSLVVKRWLNRSTRQSTFWKPKHYEAIPHYVKPHFIDIHDTYQLRTHEEVMNELRGREFEVDVERVIYKATDIRADIKGRKAVLLAGMEQFQLTELQLERLKVLVGCRYDEKSQVLKLTCELFPDYLQNHTKIHEMFHDIIMETKRAP